MTRTESSFLLHFLIHYTLTEMRLTLIEANVEASLFIKTILLIASTFNVSGFHLYKHWSLWSGSSSILVLYC